MENKSNINKIEDQEINKIFVHLLNENIKLKKEIDKLKKKKKAKKKKVEKPVIFGLNHFVNDKIIVTGNSQDKLKLGELYMEYKEWFKDNHGNLS